jgi:hypothetical protein
MDRKPVSEIRGQVQLPPGRQRSDGGHRRDASQVRSAVAHEGRSARRGSRPSAMAHPVPSEATGHAAPSLRSIRQITWRSPWYSTMSPRRSSSAWISVMAVPRTLILVPCCGGAGRTASTGLTNSDDESYVRAPPASTQCHRIKSRPVLSRVHSQGPVGVTCPIATGEVHLLCLRVQIEHWRIRKLEPIRSARTSLVVESARVAPPIGECSTPARGRNLRRRHGIRDQTSIR